MTGPMLANGGHEVKGVPSVMIRRSLRIVLRMALVAGAVALVRAVLGRLAGEPGVPRSTDGAAGDVTMSFDAWPAVPQAVSPPER